jgi:hypothetical protein
MGCGALRAESQTFHFQCVQATANAQILYYLVLPNTGGSSNFSQYTSGGASPGTTVVTHYTALRIDPNPVQQVPLTYRINIADQTFSTSTGQLCHSSSASPCPSGQAVTSMPYGVAMDCAGSGSASGSANLDLRGTPFAIVNTFSTQGSNPGGSPTFSGPQVANVTGGGYCGWNASASTYNPYNKNPLSDSNAGWDLQLALM